MQDETSTFQAFSSGGELVLFIGDYDFDLFDIEYLIRENEEARYTEDGAGIVLSPCTFKVRLYDHPSCEGELAFCWDGLWLMNISDGWKMQLGLDVANPLPFCGLEKPLLQ